MNDQTSASTLSDLYQLVADSVKGYSDAAQKVKTPRIAQFLAELASERMAMKQQLGALVRTVDPEENLDNGTIKGDLHRAWISIREALSASTDHAVLAECARGEEYLAERFRTVLEDKDTPSTAFSQLREESTKVQVTLSTIKNLSETVTYAD